MDAKLHLRHKGGTMKYIVQSEIDPEIGAEMEAQPAKLEQWVGKWQALNPIGMYFSLTRRAVTIVVEVADEDALFDCLHATWVLTNSYPEVWPVVDVEEFPSVVKRVTSGQ
jgi:hypothetical protein